MFKDPTSDEKNSGTLLPLLRLQHVSSAAVNEDDHCRNTPLVAMIVSMIPYIIGGKIRHYVYEMTILNNKDIRQLPRFTVYV
jgi:hypothetical protein